MTPSNQRNDLHDDQGSTPLDHNSRPNTLSKWKRPVFILLLLMIGCCMLAGYFFADWYRTLPEDTQAMFVGRGKCIDCHTTEAKLFEGSHHDLAMDLATPDSVLADFDGQEIEHFGITSRVFKDGDRYMVHTEGPDGEMADFEIKYVFGVSPLQQYMVELEPNELNTNKSNKSNKSKQQNQPDQPVGAGQGVDATSGSSAEQPGIGRVQVLRLSWDTQRKKWFYLSPPDVKAKLDPTDPLHWTGFTQCWNTNCAECHSTNLQKNFDLATNRYHTTFSEIDVSCEACHGPGSTHVKLAEGGGAFWDRKLGYGLAKLKSTSNIPQIESCAPCHSRRDQTQDGFQPGCSFDDYHATDLLIGRIYHDDGQIRDEDYVYGSFIQSKMFHNGIRCSDCHDPHSVRLKHDGNKVCTSCHQHPGGKYDTTAHHHHPMGGEGSRCVDCHMPHTTYMTVDSRRDHSFRIPRPDLSVKLGTPNACTQCHLDQKKLAGDLQPKNHTGQWQYLDWIEKRESGDQRVIDELSRVDQAMADACAKWYPAGQSPEKTKYYEQLAIGKTDATQLGKKTLMDLVTDRKAPGIFRASAVWELASESSPESLQVAVRALQDSDTKVVVAALVRLDSELAAVSDRARFVSESEAVKEFRPVVSAVGEMFDHGSPRVRGEAARVFAGVPDRFREKVSTPEQRKQYSAALAEYEKSLVLHRDRPSSHLALASLFEITGRESRARDAYLTAIKLDPNRVGPRTNLARLLEQEAMEYRQQIQQGGMQGGITAARMEAMLKTARTLSEQVEKFRAEEHELIRIDVKRIEGLPGADGLHYRFGMSSYLQRDMETAEKHLLIACELEPETTTYLFGLALFYQEIKKPKRALEYANRLLEIDPDQPEYRSLAQQLNLQLKN